MSVSKDLGSWTWLLSREKPLGLRQHLFDIFICNVYPQAMVGVTAVMMGTAALLSADLLEASNPANMACGFYSCIGANVTFFSRRERTPRQMHRAILLHQKVMGLAREVENLFYDSMMHFMLCCFSVPLISTLQVLHNDLHMLTFTGAFINIAVFMPLAILSQHLTDASLSVREEAFYAAFEVEGGDIPGQRRALLLVDLVATRPAKLSFKGLGPLSLSSAGNAVRSWYSFTNVLVNAGGRVRS